MVTQTSIRSSITEIQIGRYSFVVRAEDEIILPQYKGSTLRGGFGITFRRISCVNRKVAKCSDCACKEKCVYAYVFETSPSRDSDRLRNLSEIPRPFVIEPPIESKTYYKPGENIVFKLILIGRAVQYLLYFIFTFKELGNMGIGKNRGRYELKEVFDSNDQKIYDSNDQIIRNREAGIDFGRFLDTYLNRSNSIHLSFITPTRIKMQNDLVVTPEFHVLIRSLLHRLSSLAYFHCQAELDVDYTALISEAEAIKIKSAHLRWVDWERYSSRQQTKMKLGGFVGEVIYAGNIEPFLPLLLLGQYTHIGKNCTFGLGKYEMKREE